MEVCELWRALHCVVEMRLQSAALQQAVGHLCQVYPHDGIGIPKTRDEYALRRRLGGI